MSYRRAILGGGLVLLPTLAGAAFAQEWGPAKGETVPAWVFYWLLGIMTSGMLGLAGAIKILYARSTVGVEAQLVAQEKECQQREAGLRAQAENWRLVAEATEKGRREDSERFRSEEKETLRLTLTTLNEIGAALKENTRSINTLIGMSK